MRVNHYSNDLYREWDENIFVNHKYILNYEKKTNGTTTDG